MTSSQEQAGQISDDTEALASQAVRLRRGAVRPMVLTAFLDGPAHGYEVIRRLVERTDGRWRPSAGSVYPTLQRLEEKGLLSAHVDGDKKVYELTNTGHEMAEQAAARLVAHPWDSTETPDCSARSDLRAAVGQLHAAARQVGEVGSPGLIKQATSVVAAARKQLYLLLAES